MIAKFAAEKFQQPLMTALFHLALPNMLGYQSDLGHDAVFLANKTSAGDLLLWGWRETGTTIMKIAPDNLYEVRGMLKAGVNPIGNWHVILVESKRMQDQADGRIYRLNAADPSEAYDKIAALAREHWEEQNTPAWQKRLQGAA